MSEQHEHPVREGLRAARANAAPGAALIGVAVLIVGSYYVFDPVRAGLDQLAAWKVQVGVIFAICSTAIFGGLMPVLVQQLRPTTRSAQAWAALPFFMGLWAIKGLEIELLYRGQAAIFGDNNAPATVVTKVAVDQLIYCTLWGVPSLLVAYTWHECGYNWRRTWQRLGRGWYRRRAVPMLLANWGVWVPTVAVIYCISQPLQLPVQNVVLCLWAIMVLFMVQSAAPRDVKTVLDNGYEPRP